MSGSGKETQSDSIDTGSRVSGLSDSRLAFLFTPSDEALNQQICSLRTGRLLGLCNFLTGADTDDDFSSVTLDKGEPDRYKPIEFPSNVSPRMIESAADRVSKLNIGEPVQTKYGEGHFCIITTAPHSYTIGFSVGNGVVGVFDLDGQLAAESNLTQQKCALFYPYPIREGRLAGSPTLKPWFDEITAVKADDHDVVIEIDADRAIPSARVVEAIIKMMETSYEGSDSAGDDTDLSESRIIYNATQLYEKLGLEKLAEASGLAYAVESTIAAYATDAVTDFERKDRSQMSLAELIDTEIDERILALCPASEMPLGEGVIESEKPLAADITMTLVFDASTEHPLVVRKYNRYRGNPSVDRTSNDEVHFIEGDPVYTDPIVESKASDLDRLNLKRCVAEAMGLQSIIKIPVPTEEPPYDCDLLAAESYYFDESDIDAGRLQLANMLKTMMNQEFRLGRDLGDNDSFRQLLLEAGVAEEDITNHAFSDEKKQIVMRAIVHQFISTYGLSEDTHFDLGEDVGNPLLESGAILRLLPNGPTFSGVFQNFNSYNCNGTFECAFKSENGTRIVGYCNNRDYSDRGLLPSEHSSSLLVSLQSGAEPLRKKIRLDSATPEPTYRSGTESSAIQTFRLANRDDGEEALLDRRSLGIHKSSDFAHIVSFEDKKKDIMHRVFIVNGEVVRIERPYSGDNEYVKNKRSTRRRQERLEELRFIKIRNRALGIYKDVEDNFSKMGISFTDYCAQYAQPLPETYKKPTKGRQYLAKSIGFTASPAIISGVAILAEVNPYLAAGLALITSGSVALQQSPSRRVARQRIVSAKLLRSRDKTD